MPTISKEGQDGFETTTNGKEEVLRDRELCDILLREINIEGYKYPVVMMQFEIDGQLIEKGITPHSLWLAVNEYYANHCIDAKSYLVS